MSHHEEKNQNRQNPTDKNNNKMHEGANKTQNQAAKPQVAHEQDTHGKNREENVNAQAKTAEAQRKSER